MAVFPSVFGRESEFDLQFQKGKTMVQDGFLSKDALIGEMEALLLEKFGAVPFGASFMNLGSAEDYTKALAYILKNRPLHGYTVFNGRLIDGVYLPGFGRIHKESVNPYLEISTIPCNDPFELYRRVRMSEQLGGFLARKTSCAHYKVKCFNTVSDRQGGRAHSCGMHDNHLVSSDFFNRIFPEGYIIKRPDGALDEKNEEIFYIPGEHISRVAKKLIALRILGTIFRGEGKIGYDLNTPYAHYQISARSDFISDYIGCNTGGSFRPILNTRNEPHADAEWLRRLHVINGEGNRSPWSFILSIGTDALALAALHDDELDIDWELAEPLEALRTLSRDLSFKKEIKIAVGKKKTIESRTSLDLLSEILGKLERYISWAHVPSWCYTVLGEAQRTCEMLKHGDQEGEVAKMLDWKIKHDYITEVIMKKFGLNPDNLLSWQHPRVREADLNYHCISEKKVFEKMGPYVRDFEKFHSPYGEPTDDPNGSFWKNACPSDTRAYIMWLILNDPHLRERSTILNWDRIKIWNDIPSDSKTLFLGDPRMFGEKHIASLLGGDLDFSTKEKRARFIQKVNERGYKIREAEVVPASGVRLSLDSVLRVKSITRELENPSKTPSRKPDDSDEKILGLNVYGDEPLFFHETEEPPERTKDSSSSVPKLDCKILRESDDLYERSLGLLGYGNDSDKTDEETEENPAEGNPS